MVASPKTKTSMATTMPIVPMSVPTVEATEMTKASEWDKPITLAHKVSFHKPMRKKKTRVPRKQT